MWALLIDIFVTQDLCHLYARLFTAITNLAMADPFSIISGSVAIIDVCFCVFKYLKETKAGAERIEEEITALLREIEALITVNESIKNVFTTELKPCPGPLATDSAHVDSLWRNIGSNLQGCRPLVERIEIVVKEIVGKKGPRVVGKLDGFGKQIRKQSKNEELNQLRLQLTSYQNALQILLSALTM